ncbi:hypothetical protein DH2020_034881 [Rehmannia glutinosa]|uniref:Neutral ceramidase n=1 Tax=Rehmannia glutinosa TaxID=99300 RepID=A0ABR0VB85_REHGL
MIFKPEFESQPLNSKASNQDLNNDPLKSKFSYDGITPRADLFGAEQNKEENRLVANGDYLIGLGSYDMTGPAAGVNMMGYANFEQVTGGIHFRLRARTFIVAEEGPQGARFAYGELYNEENVAISGIHTCWSGGLFAICNVFGIVRRDVENAGINRSPSAYLFNPPEERAKYQNNVDTLMTLLKFVDKSNGKSIGAFSWFATHGTSMSRDNKLISGDNKGAAARLFEDWFTFGNTNFSTSSQTRLNTTSRAFCQSNVGDVSPNVLGAFCLDSGKPCDFNHSSCHGNDQLCVGRGPGYPDEILSTKIIGERQFQKAVDLFTSAKDEITGKIDYRQVYLNFTDIEVVLDGNKVVKTCPAALGRDLLRGLLTGRAFLVSSKINVFWKTVRDAIKEPSQYQVDCQKPKTVLLDTGEMFWPYDWAPAILPIQILRLGKLVILSVPGEFTTMAGRRLREAVKETLISYGNGEFNDDIQIVIAGLTNTYSQYVATFEEYEQQRYEAASTLYGPHTLSAYIQEFKKLAQALARGDKNVGRGANPRYDLLTEGTFAVVEMFQGDKWISAYDDDDLCLYFKWDGPLLSSGFYGLATIEWEVPKGRVWGFIG